MFLNEQEQLYQNIFGYFTQGSNLLKNINFYEILTRAKPSRIWTPKIYKNDLIKKVYTKKLILCEVTFEISIIHPNYTESFEKANICINIF